MGLSSLVSSLFGQSNDPVANLYELKMESLDGEVVDFAGYRGRKLLIVNTASKCGYTGQYKELQQLHESYGDRVTVLAFPANNFLWQEPGSSEEIAEFCRENFGITFRVFRKISVKGTSMHLLYRWLREQSGQSPSWNFCKYIVDESGNVVAFFGSKVNPLDKKIIDLIA